MTLEVLFLPDSIHHNILSSGFFWCSEIPWGSEVMRKIKRAFCRERGTGRHTSVGTGRHTFMYDSEEYYCCRDGVSYIYV
ncbi:hypothetical protein WDU94_008012 [Cyamophila willieti]